MAPLIIEVEHTGYADSNVAIRPQCAVAGFWGPGAHWDQGPDDNGRGIDVAFMVTRCSCSRDAATLLPSRIAVDVAEASRDLHPGL